MPNVQQPEMRRSEENPLVQDSKGPGPDNRAARTRGRTGRRIPPDQVSPHGPSPRPVAEDPDRGAAGRSRTRR